PGTRALPAGGRDPAALPGAPGLVVLLLASGGVTDGAGAGGAPSQPGPAGRRPGAPPGSPLCPREHLELSSEFAATQAHFAQGIALYDSQRHHAHAVRYGQDPGVRCRAHAALTLWWLGYPDQALHRSHEALTLAQEVVHPLSLAFAACFAAWLHQFRREGRLAQERAEAGIALATEHGFTGFLAQGTLFRGWALAARSGEPEAGQGQRQEGIAQMRQGLAVWQATGAKVFRPDGLALLA